MLVCIGVYFAITALRYLNQNLTLPQEGIKFLEKTSPDLAQECKTAAKENVQNGSGDAPEVTKNGKSPVKLARDNTMVTTAQVPML